MSQYFYGPMKIYRPESPTLSSVSILSCTVLMSSMAIAVLNVEDIITRKSCINHSNITCIIWKVLISHLSEPYINQELFYSTLSDKKANQLSIEYNFSEWTFTQWRSPFTNWGCQCTWHELRTSCPGSSSIW